VTADAHLCYPFAGLTWSVCWGGGGTLNAGFDTSLSATIRPLSCELARMTLTVIRKPMRISDDEQNYEDLDWYCVDSDVAVSVSQFSCLFPFSK
jgi:hypothetical protein